MYQRKPYICPLTQRVSTGGVSPLLTENIMRPCIFDSRFKVRVELCDSHHKKTFQKRHHWRKLIRADEWVKKHCNVASIRSSHVVGRFQKLLHFEWLFMAELCSTYLDQCWESKENHKNWTNIRFPIRQFWWAQLKNRAVMSRTSAVAALVSYFVESVSGWTLSSISNSPGIHLGQPFW